MRRFNESFGGRLGGKRMLPPDVFESMEKELEAWFREHNQGTERRVVLPNEYLLLVPRKARKVKRSVVVVGEIPDPDVAGRQTHDHIVAT